MAISYMVAWRTCEAPTAGSVILAGVLLKMGAYGFIRFSLGILPIASHIFSPLIFLLSIIAIIYTSLVALAQTDIKKLVAYSSVAHMGIVTVGIFIANQQSIEGAIIQMLSHGIVSAALFLCVGVLYDRMKTREISFYGGLVQKMPMFASLLMIFTLASIGLPKFVIPFDFKTFTNVKIYTKPGCKFCKYSFKYQRNWISIVFFWFCNNSSFQSSGWL